MKQIHPSAEKGLNVANGVEGRGRRLTLRHGAAAIRGWRDALMPRMLVESLTTAALLGGAAIGAVATEEASAATQWGTPVTVGAETLDLARLPAGVVRTSKSKLENNVDLAVLRGTNPSDPPFFVSTIQCPPDKDSTLTSVQFLVFDPNPPASGGKGFFVYASPDQASLSPYGADIVLNTFRNQSVLPDCPVVYQPWYKAFPELATDLELAKRVNGVQVCTWNFPPGLIKSQPDGTITFRVLNFNDGPASSSPAYLLGITGEDAPGVTTYRSDTFQTPEGKWYRDSRPYAEAPFANWSPDVKAISMSFTYRTEEEVSQLPPPPSPTVYRSNAEGAPDGHGDFVTLSLISDGHPVWTAERTGSAVEGTWVRKPAASYSAPAGQPLRIVKPIAASPSFFRLVR